MMTFEALRAIRCAIISVALVSGLLTPQQSHSAEPTESPNLRTQIETLAANNGIRLHGAERIEQTTARKIKGELTQSLKQLLAGYNFAIVRDQNGAIRTISVSGLKRPAPDETVRISVKTIRRGAGHFLNAVIMGRRPIRTRIQFLIDTGASMVVLPSSMAGALGYGEDDLTETILQTANGEILGQIGTLRSVEVGRAVARDIAVAFVDDERLGKNRLLGMSFLGRFIVTIDDAANVISMVKSTK